MTGEELISSSRASIIDVAKEFRFFVWFIFFWSSESIILLLSSEFAFVDVQRTNFQFEYFKLINR